MARIPTTGATVKQAREAIGGALGRRLSQHDLGAMLQLSRDSNAVRHWETAGPTGPGAVALYLMLVLIECGRVDVVRALIDDANT